MNSEIKSKIDELLIKYKVQPVGNGYYDLIVSKDNVKALIDELTALDVKVNEITWWCHCVESNKECPHGMGGSESKYYEGMFSEMNLPTFEFENNDDVIDFILNQSKEEDFYLDCLVPALWLNVPDEWKNSSTPL